MKCRLLAPSMLILLIGFSIADAFAQGRVLRGLRLNTLPSNSNMIKTYDEDTLRYPQLLECVIRQNELSRLIDKMNQIVAQVNDLQDRGLAEEAELEIYQQELARLENSGFSSNAEIDEYNRKVDDFNVKLERLLELDALQKQLRGQRTEQFDEYERSLNVYTHDCDDKKYYQDDMDRVQMKMALDSLRD